MKRCPTCDKTFDDAMRFCQTDGTPLVEAAEPVDPYKTMVARPEDIAAAIPPMPESIKPDARAEEEVLDLPPADPKKTMYASEAEIRKAMSEVDDRAGEQVIDLPPMAEPEPPRFIEPTLGTPPSSSFAERTEAPAAEDTGSKTTPPIPSPFEGSMVNFQKPSAPDLNPEPLNISGSLSEPPAFEPPPSPFASADPPSPFSAASEPPSSPIAPADPTPTPAAQNNDWQDNNQMQNPQFQGAAAAGQSKVLALVSLIIGILGMTICCGGVIPNLIAIVLGFVARSKANSNPAAYGGSGLAMGGIITGVLGLLLSIVMLVFLFFMNGMAIIMREMPR